MGLIIAAVDIEVELEPGCNSNEKGPFELGPKFCWPIRIVFELIKIRSQFKSIQIRNQSELIKIRSQFE